MCGITHPFTQIRQWAKLTEAELLASRHDGQTIKQIVRLALEMFRHQDLPESILQKMPVIDVVYVLATLLDQCEKDYNVFAVAYVEAKDADAAKVVLQVFMQEAASGFFREKARGSFLC